ncbi:MAG TPA: recombinase family protein [Longimicrobiales bacterium]|nr:recombinase family protein [Longimicrobiales bacterium]
MRLLHKGVAKGVVVWIRQSSKMQVRDHVGSGFAQSDQLQTLETLGLNPDKIITIHAAGEAANERDERLHFEHLIETIASGQAGVLLAVHADRLARNETDSLRLRQVLAETGTLLMMRGRVYNLADSADVMMFTMLTAIAEFDNANRALTVLTAALALARRKALCIPVPTGLTWGAPRDPAFRDAMERAGLADWLDQDFSAAPTYYQKEQPHHIFPFPDRQVYTAVRLAFEILLETGSLSAVLAEIENGDRWPVRGCFPVVRARRYTEDVKVDWKRVVGREDGRDHIIRSRLNDFLRCQAFFGVYSFESPALASSLGPAAATMRVENAFRSYLPLGDLQRVNAALSDPGRPFQRRHSVPRNHALPNVRCAHIMPDGQPCGAKLVACYSAVRQAAYGSAECSAKGHKTNVPTAAVDSVAYDLIVRAFSTAMLRESVERIKAGMGAAKREVQVISEDLADIEAEIEAVENGFKKASKAGRTSLAEQFESSLEKLVIERTRKEAELRLARHRSAAEAEVTQSEVGAILSLASDVPALLQKAAHIEGKTRAVTRELVSAVHVSRQATYRYVVEVEFPSGARTSRVVRVSKHRVAATAVERRIAADTLGPFLDLGVRRERFREADAAAKKCAELLNRSCGANRPRWTPARVWAAAYDYVETQEAPPPEVEVTTASELADEVGVNVEGLLNALWDPDGGRRVAGDQPIARPPEDVLQKAFPEYARSFVARREEWEVADTLTLEEAKERASWGRQWTVRRAKRRQCLVNDAAGVRYVSWSRLIADVDPDTPSYRELQELALTKREARTKEG